MGLHLCTYLFHLVGFIIIVSFVFVVHFVYFGIGFVGSVWGTSQASRNSDMGTCMRRLKLLQ